LSRRKSNTRAPISRCNRYGTLEDPFGHRWSIGTPVREVSMEEAREAMRKMSKQPA